MLLADCMDESMVWNPSQLSCLRNGGVSFKLLSLQPPLDLERKSGPKKVSSSLWPA